MDQETNNKIAPSTPVPRPRSAPIIERAPLPIVEVQGNNHLVTYVNSAFCSLLEKPRFDLIGKPFHEIVPKGEECLPVLDRVYQTGEAATIAKEDEDEAAQWLFAMWPSHCRSTLASAMNTSGAMCPKLLLPIERAPRIL